MPDFSKHWDSIVPVDTPTKPSPQFLASITEVAINEYLAKHRVWDKERYLVTRQFDANGQTLFDFSMIVGGSKQDQNKGNANPLRLTFPVGGKFKKPSMHQVVYEYPALHGSYTYDQLAEPLPNISVASANTHIYMQWKKTAGGSWSHLITGINFDLEAKFDIIEADDRYTLQITPIRLTIDKSSVTKIKQEIGKQVNKGRNSPIDSATQEKIDDLFMAVMQLAASKIGPDLVMNLQIPVFELPAMAVFPSFMNISNGIATIGAGVSSAAAAAEMRTRIAFVQSAVNDAFEADIRQAGGIENILWDKKTIAKANALLGSDRDKWLIAQPTKSQGSINAAFKNVNTFTAHQNQKHAALIRDKLGPATKSIKKAAAVAGAVNEALAVGITEQIFDTLVADVGGKSGSGFTPRVSLVLVRGRLGYEYQLGVPDISITPKGLAGSVYLRLFAGLFYQVKEVLDCSWKWSNEKKIGLGIKGVPKLEITTRSNSKGLAIHASIDLSKVGFETGLGDLIDKIASALLQPFRSAIEAALNLVLTFLSFVIIPVRFAVPGQATALELSRFPMQNYKRGQQTDPRNNFLRIDADMKPVKVLA